MARGVRVPARAGRAQPGVRSRHSPEPLGPPAALFRRRGLPGAGPGRAPAPRRLRKTGWPAGRDEGRAPAPALRRALPRPGTPPPEADQGQPGRTGRGTRPLAGGDHPSRGRLRGPLPAGRVRGRSPRRPSGAGADRPGIPRPPAVLPAHPPDGRPQGAPDRCRAAAFRRGRRPGGGPPDELRRREDPLDAGALPPLLGDARLGAPRNRGPASRGGDREPSCRRPFRGPGREPDFAGEPGPQTGRRPRPDPVGRDRLAAGREGRLPPRPERRQARNEPGSRARHAAPRLRPLPDPGGRMGGLCPPAARPIGPSRRFLRDPVFLRPEPHRVGEGGGELPAGHLPAGLERGLCRAERRGSRRPPGAAGAEPAPQRARSSGLLVEAGLGRRGFRDRAPAAVPTDPGASLQAPGPDGAPLRGVLPEGARPLPRRMRRDRLPAAHRSRLSDPPGGLRPPPRGLGHSPPLPADPGGAAAHGGGDPRALAGWRPQPADPALDGPARPRPGALRAHPLPRGPLGSDPRRRRGGERISPGAAGSAKRRLRESAGREPGGPLDLSRIGPEADGGPARHRSAPGAARLRASGREAGGVRRCPAAAHRRRDLPLPGRVPLLVWNSAHGCQAGPRPRRGSSPGARQGPSGDRAAASRGGSSARVVRRRSSGAPELRRSSGPAPGPAGDPLRRTPPRTRTPAQPGGGGGRRDPDPARKAAPGVPERAALPRRRPDPLAGP